MARQKKKGNKAASGEPASSGASPATAPVAAPVAAAVATPVAAPVPAPVPTPVAAPAATPAAAQVARPPPATSTQIEEVLREMQQKFYVQDPSIVKRQPAGKLGKPYKIVANFYPVRLPQGYVYHYDVQILSVSKKEKKNDKGEPRENRTPCTLPAINRTVFNYMNANFREFEKCQLGFDGRKNAYAKKELAAFRRKFVFPEFELEIEGRKQTFSAEIKFASRVSFTELHAFYQKQCNADQCQDAIQAADIILRTGPGLSNFPVGKSFYPFGRVGYDLGGGLESRSGFHCTVKLTESQPAVIIDKSDTAFFKEVPLLTYLGESLGTNRWHTLLSDFHRAQASKEIRHLKVRLNHLVGKPVIRLESVCRNNAVDPRNVFEYEGRKVTVAQYYKDHHKISLQCPQLQLVRSTRGDAKYPMELCTIVAGQQCRRKLNPQQTQTMIKSTAIPPFDRFNRIKEAKGKLVNESARSFLTEFSMAIDAEPLTLQCRVLDPPTPTYKTNASAVSDGCFQISSYTKPGTLNNWVIAVNDESISDSEVQSLVTPLIAMAKKRGMTVFDPVIVRTPRRVNEQETLQEVKKRYPNVQYTFVLLHRDSDYAALKFAAETSDLNMLTQCVKQETLKRRASPQTFDNIALKMNAKMGGVNNSLGDSRHEVLKRPYMVIGAHLHSTVGSETPSIAALVSSYDATPAKYHVVTRVQKTNRTDENDGCIKDMEAMFSECIEKFLDNSGRRPPKHLFIFRDAVNERKFHPVKRFELESIRKACAKYWDDNVMPMIVYIFVTKRHHVRFRPLVTPDGRFKNIKAGTIVDHTIVDPAYFDFYLCSHQGIQGTSRPAHYHVVENTSTLKPDDIYQIVYSLCYVYARCPRSVSIPAPSYYATLVTKRALDYFKAGVYPSESASGPPGAHSNAAPQAEDLASLERFKNAQNVQSNLRSSMYFI